MNYSTPRNQTIKINFLFLNELKLANNVPREGFLISHGEMIKG